MRWPVLDLQPGPCSPYPGLGRTGKRTKQINKKDKRNEKRVLWSRVSCMFALANEEKSEGG